MDFIFKEWQKAIEKLQNSLEKDVEEVRRQKEEVQSMKREIFNQISGGQYFRDSKRIVISAPEIIIGNVDKSGDLWGNSAFSKVTIRANDIAVEGVGSSGAGAVGGCITNRATSIRNIAVDPGIDGLENVVRQNSEIVNQARSIVIQANEDEGYFSQTPLAGTDGAVTIHADKSLLLDATLSNESHSARIKDEKKDLKERQSALKKLVADGKKSVSGIMSDIETTLGKTEGKNETMADIYANVKTLSEVQEEYEALTMTLYSAMSTYLHDLAELAEVNRAISALDATEKKLSSAKADFTKKETGSSITMNSETVSVSCIDGDGNVRTTEGSGVFVNGRNFRVSSAKADGALMDECQISLNSRNIEISAADNVVKDKDADNPAVGEFKLKAKNISVEAVDYERKDTDVKEKALTKDGRFSLRAENINLNADDTEGKAVGEVNVNAKAIALKSMDLDKESREEKDLCAGSTMVLLSEKMYAGALEKDKNKSKSVQIASEQIGIIAKTTAEMQQDKAAVQLSGGNFSAGGGKSEIFGDTVINGKAEIKGETKVPKLTADNLEAKSSFKSTNISDGIAVPAAGAAGKISAKITEEAAPKPAPKPKKEAKKK